MFNLRSLDLNLLTVFEAIYELGSVSAAADRLALSQSATSHALSRLRQACKDELFLRAGQGLSSTQVAQAMYPIVSQALESLRATLAEASGFDPAQSKRHFRIGIPHPMGPFYAVDLRTVVSDAAPGIILTFDTVSRPVDLEDSLRDGVADLAIDWLPIELNPFVNRKLFDDRLILVARRNHPLATAHITLKDLQEAEFVALHRRRDSEHLPRALREIHNLQLHDVVRVSELLEIPTVVASTDLLGLMPSSIGAFLEKRMGLRIIPMPVDLPLLPIYLIWHESRSRDSGHRWLREIVMKEGRRLARA